MRQRYIHVAIGASFYLLAAAGYVIALSASI